MLIGERLRAIREAKNLSQGDIEKRCGLIRCHISRVEKATSYLRSKRWRSSPTSEEE